MGIEKRTWKNADGGRGTAWRVTIGRGKDRETKTFDRKRDADDYFANAKLNKRRGLHLDPNRTPTVAEAGKAWIKICIANKLEPTTVDAYQNHLDFHICPYIGEHKLGALTVAIVRKWQDDLRAAGRSADMVRRCTGDLGALLAEALERGQVAQNVVRLLRPRKRTTEKRAKRKLVVGVDIPLPSEIDSILGAAGDDRVLFLVFIRCGLRSSELRGLRWADVDLDKSTLHVRQRADRYNEIGRPKSDAGDRSIPLPPGTVKALREWKERAPKSEYDFANGAGNLENRGNIVTRKWWPLQVRAGVSMSTDEVDEKGKPIMVAKYSGLHALRHYFASWCINPPPLGLGLPAKAVQERLGHSSITMTMDTYGHLFPRGDDSVLLAAAEGKFG